MLKDPKRVNLQTSSDTSQLVGLTITHNSGGKSQGIIWFLSLLVCIGASYSSVWIIKLLICVFKTYVSLTIHLTSKQHCGPACSKDQTYKQ